MSREREDMTEVHTGSRRDSAREIQEMERIEKGLEAFLEQELRGMPKQDDTEEISWQEEEQYDTQYEEQYDAQYEEQEEEQYDEQEEEGEIDLRGDYLEDWDSPRRKKSTGTAQRRTAQKSGSERSGNGRSVSQRGAGSRSTNSRNGNRTGRNGNGYSGSRGGRRAEKARRKKSRFKWFLIALVLIIALLGAAQYYLVGVVYNKMKYEEVESEAITKAPMKEDGVINILLIGNDSRENGEDGRSDAMILLSISSKTKKIYMTSLLRDMYVEIPGHDGNRLNAAYSYGGAELLMETVEKNLDISVNRYVLVNFEAFAKLVDAVGGVDLELSSEEVEYVNAYLWEYNVLTERPEGTDYMDTSLSGTVHLNGPQALAYSRNRYLGTDFGRTERQRKVLSAVIDKLPKAVVTNPKELIDGLMPNLTTNLTQKECYQLSFLATKLLTYEIVQGSIPLEGTYKNADIRGMAVLEVDFDANKQYLQENLYGSGEKH